MVDIYQDLQLIQNYKTFFCFVAALLECIALSAITVCACTINNHNFDATMRIHNSILNLIVQSEHCIYFYDYANPWKKL